MKKLIIAAAVLVLAGCSTPREPQLTIAPSPASSNQQQVNNLPVVVKSKDLRTAQFVAVIDSGRSNVKPLHASQNLRVVLEDTLSRQLSAQGFRVVANGPGMLRLDILDALVRVKHTVFKHDMEASVQLQLVAESPDGRFVKRYTGKSTQSGVSSASPDDIEMALNNLLEAVLQDIANDEQLLDHMRAHF